MHIFYLIAINCVYQCVRVYPIYSKVISELSTGSLTRRSQLLRLSPYQSDLKRNNTYYVRGVYADIKLSYVVAVSDHIGLMVMAANTFCVFRRPVIGSAIA